MPKTYTGFYGSAPIEPMRPGRYIKKRPKRKTSSRIIKRPHKCPGKQYKLVGIINGGAMGYEYHLICKTCKNIVGKLHVSTDAVLSLEVDNFIKTITGKGYNNAGNQGRIKAGQN